MNPNPDRAARPVAFAAVAVLLLVALLALGGPAVEAARQKVVLAGGSTTAKIKDSNGTAIESLRIPKSGLFKASGSGGAIAVREFAGGAGLLGAGDCTASTEPAQGPLPNVIDLGGRAIITGVLVTGTGTVRMTSSGIGSGQVPLANIVVNAQHPNEFLSLEGGFRLSTPVRFTGVDGTACNFVVFGLGKGDPPFN